MHSPGANDEEVVIDLSKLKNVLDLKRKIIRVSQLNESKRKLTDYVQRLEKAYAGNVKQCGEAQDKLRSVHDRLTEVNASNQSLREELAKVEAEFAAEEAEIEAVEAEAASLEAEVERMKEEQAATERERLIEPRRAEVQKIRSTAVSKAHALLLQERKRADLDRVLVAVKKEEEVARLGLEQLCKAVPRVIDFVKTVVDAGGVMTKAEKTALELLELYVEADFDADDTTASELEVEAEGGDNDSGSEGKGESRESHAQNESTGTKVDGRDHFSAYSSSSEDEASSKQVPEKEAGDVSEKLNASLMSSSEESD